MQSARFLAVGFTHTSHTDHHATHPRSSRSRSLSPLQRVSSSFDHGDPTRGCSLVHGGFVVLCDCPAHLLLAHFSRVSIWCTPLIALSLSTMESVCGVRPIAFPRILSLWCSHTCTARMCACLSQPIHSSVVCSVAFGWRCCPRGCDTVTSHPLYFPRLRWYAHAKQRESLTTVCDHARFGSVHARTTAACRVRLVIVLRPWLRECTE
jgi:hypothetical protein